MYVKITALAVALLLAGASSSAFAGTDASAGSASNSNAGAAAKSSSTTGPSSSSSGAQLTENNYNPKQAPEVYVSPSNTTAPCILPGGVGVSGGGWGVGITGGIKDPGCELRNRVEMLRSLGLFHAAIALACDSDPKIATALTETNEKCHDTTPEYVAPPPAAPAPQAINVSLGLSADAIKALVTLIPPPPRVAPAPVVPPVRQPPHRSHRPKTCTTVVKPATPPACTALHPAINK